VDCDARLDRRRDVVGLRAKRPKLKIIPELGF